MPSANFYAMNGNPREQRESAVVSPVGAGATIWLTGLPSAGKSTNEVKVSVAVVLPYNEARNAVRVHHDAQNTSFFEVRVAAPVAVCAERDVKGLYAKQRMGHLAGLSGVDDPYEEPEKPDLRVLTRVEDVETSVRAVHSLSVERSLA